MAVARAASAESPGSRSTDPDATSAAYSPSECPAPTSKVIPSALRTAKAARSHANTASWTMSVRDSDSASRATSATSQPRIPDARSSASLPAG